MKAKTIKRILSVIVATAIVLANVIILTQTAFASDIEEKSLIEEDVAKSEDKAIVSTKDERNKDVSIPTGVEDDIEALSTLLALSGVGGTIFFVAGKKPKYEKVRVTL